MRHKGIEYKTEGESLKIYLYGNIRSAFSYEDDNVSDFISAEAVKHILTTQNKEKEIVVHINSRGGDVFESIAIHNLLKDDKRSVFIKVDGLAGSGASLIAMAGDSVEMKPNSLMMIHRASTILYGNANDLRKVANDLEKIDEAVINSYKSKFVGEDKEIAELIDAETWLTADDAKTLGFIDSIENETNAKNIVSMLAVKYKDKNPIKNSFFNNFK